MKWLVFFLIVIVILMLCSLIFLIGRLFENFISCREELRENYKEFERKMRELEKMAGEDK